MNYIEWKIMKVCREEDQFTIEQKTSQARWVVTLSDEGIVIQDDNRPETPEPAWLRLQDFCKENDLYITGMYLQFRSHIEYMPQNADGYYFMRGFTGSSGGMQQNTYNVGIRHGDSVHVTYWRVPELLHLFESTVRTVEMCEEYLI